MMLICGVNINPGEGVLMDEVVISSELPVTENTVVLPQNQKTTGLQAYLHSSAKLARLSLQMAASYTFSFEVVVLVYTMGRINNNQNNLAAISLISSMLNTIVYIGATPLFSISIIAAEELGAYRIAEKYNSEEFQLNADAARDQIAVIYRHSLLLAGALTLPMVACLVFSQPLLDSLQQNKDVARITQNFLRPFALWIPAFMFRMCSEQIIYGFGQSKKVMQITLASFILTVPLGISLSLGSAGLPNLGYWGLLIGCITESYISSVAMLAYVACSKQFQPFKLFDFSRPWEKYVSQRQKIGALGGFILLTSLSETIGLFINSTLAGLIGVEQQAALSLCSQFTLVTFLLQTASGQTCSQEMNRALGQKQFELVSLLGKSGLISSVALVFPIPLVFAISPELLTGIVGNSNSGIQTILNSLVPLMAVATLIDLVRYNLLQQLLILKDVNRSALISTGSLLFGIILSAVLGLKTDMGIYGVATGYAMGVSLATISLLARWIPRIQPEAIRQLCEVQDNVGTGVTQTSRCCSMFFLKPAVKSTTLEDEVVNPVHGSIAMV